MAASRSRMKLEPSTGGKYGPSGQLTSLGVGRMLMERKSSWSVSWPRTHQGGAWRALLFGETLVMQQCRS